MKHYDYIFAGGGLAALMTVYRMVKSGDFGQSEILIVDPQRKDSNDRTWCYWSTPGFEWDFLASQSWKNVLFKNDSIARTMDISPYRYNMIRGIDFYNHVIPVLKNSGKVTFLQDSVVSHRETDQGVEVLTAGSNYLGKRFISSIYDPAPIAQQSRHPFLQQHFIGWHIKSDKPVFNKSVATFMDFSVEQKHNTRFMYVLPFSDSEALIEYTLFSADLLARNEYEDAIKLYIANLGIKEYEIIATEKGAIPMTTFPFWDKNTKNTIFIGTGGGWTKASTGYTFRHASEKSAKLVAFLKAGKNFEEFHNVTRHDWYDLLLLDILAEKNEKGAEIFSSMFLKGKPSPVLKFLDAETTVFEDLQVIARCPKRLFVSALFKKMLR